MASPIYLICFLSRNFLGHGPNAIRGTLKIGLRAALCKITRRVADRVSAGARAGVDLRKPGQAFRSYIDQRLLAPSPPYTSSTLVDCGRTQQQIEPMRVELRWDPNPEGLTRETWEQGVPAWIGWPRQSFRRWPSSYPLQPEDIFPVIVCCQHPDTATALLAPFLRLVLIGLARGSL